MSKEHVFSCDWQGRPLTFKTGRLARQADAAVTVQYGDTVVLATVVESKTERDGIDFFPLMVEFEERLYAAGIIKGSRWIKREGRPSDDAILTGRMIDRSIRPLFNQSCRRDVQVVLTVLSVDKENDYDIVALVAASAALSISGVDWNGPIAGIRVGRHNGEYVVNPTYAQRIDTDLDVIIAGTTERVLMLEADASEVAENDMFEAIMAGQAAMAPAIDLIKKMQSELGISRSLKADSERTYDEITTTVLSSAEQWLQSNITNILFDKIYYW